MGIRARTHELTLRQGSRWNLTPRIPNESHWPQVTDGRGMQQTAVAAPGFTLEVLNIPERDASTAWGPKDHAESKGHLLEPQTPEQGKI